MIHRVVSAEIVAIFFHAKKWHFIVSCVKKLELKKVIHETFFCLSIYATKEVGFPWNLVCAHKKCWDVCNFFWHFKIVFPEARAHIPYCAKNDFSSIYIGYSVLHNASNRQCFTSSMYSKMELHIDICKMAYFPVFIQLEDFTLSCVIFPCFECNGFNNNLLEKQSGTRESSPSRHSFVQHSLRVLFLQPLREASRFFTSYLQNNDCNR